MYYRGWLRKLLMVLVLLYTLVQIFYGLTRR